MPTRPTIDASPLHLRLPVLADQDDWLAIAKQPDVLDLGLLEFELAMSAWEDRGYGLFVVTGAVPNSTGHPFGAGRPVS